MRTKTISKILIITMVMICLFNSTIYADEELVKRGDSSDEVVLLQQLLKEKGYFDYDIITGYYGKITEDAVKDFQRANGLKVDGIAGTATWAALLSQSQTDEADVSGYEETEENVEAQEVSSDDEIAYSIGMECADIALIQSRLIELGFYNYSNVTGYFGSITQKAVKSFQRACSLEVTGIVDESTWNKLFADYVASTLLSGTVSDDVIPLQQRLAELGYYSFTVDGKYGSKTKEAVKYFQRACGITANGIADAQTQELLFSEDAISEQEARRIITTDNDSGINTTNAEPSGEEIIELAKLYLGYPYVYGAKGPDAFDCAGFVSYIYDLVGISLPSSIGLENFDNYGTKINNRTDLKAGDLVFFDTVSTDGNPYDHIGIYIGDGNFIHVDEFSGNRAVVIDSITKSNGWYTARFTCGRRIVE